MFIYSRENEFYTVSVPYSTIRYGTVKYLPTARFNDWKNTLPEQKAYRFLCKITWLIAATFSVFIFSAIWIVKNVTFFYLKNAMQIVTKTKPSVVILERVPWHFLTVFRFLTQKRINSQFFCANDKMVFFSNKRKDTSR